jgi:hypothetical protein
MEDVMERKGKLHDAQVRREMAAGFRDGADDEVPYLVGQYRELRGCQFSYVSRRVDGVKEHQEDL